MKKNLLAAIGCKSHETTPKRCFQGLKFSADMEPKTIEPLNTIAFVSYNMK